MGEFSLTHLLLIAVIFLIFFGPSRLPQLGQSLGKAIRGFKTGLSEIDVDAKDIHDAATQANKTNVNGQIHTHVTPGSTHTSATSAEAQKQSEKQNS